jgi:transglutaminase/protease-like cytokinesis protein 3
MAAYRMFTEAGLEARIISGIGNGASHAWNIVKVEGKWYNIDLTWDDPLSYNGEAVLTYDYFLKNTKEFSDHRRDAEYRTDQFLKNYTIAKTSYTIK